MTLKEAIEAALNKRLIIWQESKTNIWFSIKADPNYEVVDVWRCGIPNSESFHVKRIISTDWRVSTKRELNEFTKSVKLLKYKE